VSFELRALLSLFFLLNFIAPALAQQPDSTSAPGEVVLLGSSSMNGPIAYLMADEFKNRGLKVQRIARSSAGMSRPDFFDWMKEVRKVKINENTQAVIVYLGVNDAQGIWLRKSERDGQGRRDKWVIWSDKRWAGIYRDRVTRFSNLLCEKGARKVIWLTPIDVKPKRLQKRLNRIRQMQEEGAAASKCGTSVPGTGDLNHILQGTRLGKAVRSHDGSHMTRKGSRVLWQRIGVRVLSLVGLEP